MTATATTTTVAPAGTWPLDPVHSSAHFAVKHMVVATFRGQFDDFDAKLVVDEHGTARLTGTVKADSIVVKDENLAGHLKSPDFFDTERYPDITYVSTLRREGDELIVDGELTIKGHTHPVEARGTITDPASRSATSRRSASRSRRSSTAPSSASSGTRRCPRAASRSPTTSRSRSSSSSPKA